MDGLGLAEPGAGNAVDLAKTPNLDYLISRYPTGSLLASAEAVGLPMGQMGNSEVGHLNIGAGRVVYQPLLRISRDMEDGSFFEKGLVKKALDPSFPGKTHLLGLLSPGGVHSHLDHLKGLLKEASKLGLERVYVHGFLDGRDTPPNSGLEDVKNLEAYMKEVGLGSFATISGRYYAMDRDRRWERVKLAYDAMVLGEGERISALAGIERSYEKGVFDEFVLPFVCDEKGLIAPGDRVIFFNFRPDRARELTQALSQENFEGFESLHLDLDYYTMSEYSKDYRGIQVFYPPETIEDTLGEVISSHGLKQYRSAETEKYPHITFFFNGSREIPFPGEDRLLVDSPKVATYDLLPEMSAYEVSRGLVERLKENQYDFYLVNFANPDMVGHSGSLEAAIQAVEAVDRCLGEIVPLLEEKGIAFIITADHGNAEEMILPASGRASTQHSLNPVPIILGGLGDVCIEEGGKLSDLAPSLLEILGIEIPATMTGRVIFRREK